MVVDKCAVGLFYSWDEVKNAILALKDRGFNSKQINLMTRDNNQIFVDTNLDVKITTAIEDVTNRLVDLGIPETKAKFYSDRIKGGSYFLMLDGSDLEIYRNEEILNQNGIEELAIYDAFDLDNSKLKETLDRESRITNKQGFAEPQREMSIPDNDPDVTVVQELENLF